MALIRMHRLRWKSEELLALITPVSAPVSVSVKANMCWLHLIHAHSQTLCLGSISCWRLSLKRYCLCTSLTHVIQLSKSIFQAWERMAYVEKKLVVLCYKESRFISVKTFLDFWKLYCLQSMCVSQTWLWETALFFFPGQRTLWGRKAFLHMQQSSSRGLLNFPTKDREAISENQWLILHWPHTYYLKEKNIFSNHLCFWWDCQLLYLLSLVYADYIKWWFH